MSRLLTESESAKFAGVSPETIRQYKNFGLLTGVLQDNQLLFEEQAVSALFHSAAVKKSETNHSEHSPQEQRVDAPLAQQPLAEQVEKIIDHPNSEINPQVPRSRAHLPETDHYDLVETNRSLREQMKSLKEERDWLRERIEKLETRCEREQMLLISESETIRSLLLTQNQKKKGFFARALPWLK